MLAIRHNPEFIRHRRGELRPTRALILAMVAFLVCALVGISCWTDRLQLIEEYRRVAQQTHTHWAEQQFADALANKARQFWHLFYGWLIGIEAGALAFWSLLSNAQAVSREREHKTYDFQRITRLTSAELLVGKVLGEPILAYFAVICVLPLTVLAGLLGGSSLLSILLSYIVIFVAAVFLGLSALWLSTLVESRSRGIGILGAGAIALLAGMSFSLGDSDFPGFAAFSPITALVTLHGDTLSPRYGQPTLFGWAFPWPTLSLILYVTFGAWLSLMLVRNLKCDYDKVRPLSRWQAVGCAVFLNVLVYAFYRPMHDSHYYVPIRDSVALSTFMVVVNGLILFALGLATLTPHEELKTWWREREAKREGWFSENGLSWPWLVLFAIVAYLLLIWGLLTWKHAVGFDRHALHAGAVELLAVLLFVVRDILFIQWCRLTKLRQPLVKGLLYICLYYIGAIVLAVMAGAYSGPMGIRVFSLLTPFMVFSAEYGRWHFSTAIYGGLGIQLVLIAVVLFAISKRLQATAAVITSAV